METATPERAGRTADPRPEKIAVVEEVRDRLDGTSAAILAEYRGLSVGQMAELRSRLRDAGGEIKVYKNTLVRFAARDLGLEIEELLTGPTAIAFVAEKPTGDAGDAVEVAKVLKDFGRDFPALVVKGGLLGDKLLSADDTRALADVEPREVLLAKLAGAMAAPMQQFAGLLQALPRNMAYGLKALIDQGGAPGAPAGTDQATGAVGGAPEGEAGSTAGTDEAPEISEAHEPSEAVTANEDAQPETDQTDDATGEPDSVDTPTDNQES